MTQSFSDDAVKRTAGKVSSVRDDDPNGLISAPNHLQLATFNREPAHILGEIHTLQMLAKAIPQR
jgi:hypothetical protein